MAETQIPSLSMIDDSDVEDWFGLAGMSGWKLWLLLLCLIVMLFMAGLIYGAFWLLTSPMKIWETTWRTD
jgi:hypothetical protein